MLRCGRFGYEKKIRVAKLQDRKHLPFNLSNLHRINDLRPRMSGCYRVRRVTSGRISKEFRAACNQTERSGLHEWDYATRRAAPRIGVGEFGFGPAAWDALPEPYRTSWNWLGAVASTD